MPTDATRPTDDEVERLGEALFAFSDRLRAHSGFFEEQRNHDAYEAVVSAFQRLTTPQPHIAAEPGEVISVAGLLRWLEESWPAESGSDFNQGVVRGFEIIKAQLEHGHIQRYTGATLTATEPQAVGEGALPDEPCEECDDSGYIQRGGRQEICDCPCGQDVHRQMDAEAAALRQPSTDRESVIEECAKVADDCAVLADRVEVINHFGVEAAQNAVKLAEGIASAIRARAALGSGGGG